uniref:EF-hand domain-containing protein n=1 Tax=Meloidogyne hapla TaxID=6305 RepID=A0A1I8B7P7_MELHA
MTSFSCESDSAEQASTTADEDNGGSTRHSTSDSVDGSTTDTDSNNELLTTPFANKNLVSKEGSEKKYSNGIFDNKKINFQNDTETRNLLDDVGEDFDEDYNLNLQESEIELDPRMFDLSEEQLNYYTNCFLYLMQKTRGTASMNGAIQGVDRIVLDFFRKSRLDDLTLSKIWSLSDVNEDGFLNLNEFVTAMHLVVLHVKCNVSIPAELPHSARPPSTPNRTIIRFEDGIFGAFPESRPNSAINSFKKIIPECISSSSGDSQQMTKSLLNPNEKQEFSNTFGGNNLIKKFATDISTSTKQHSFSDDHLYSSTATRHDESIAKFSDVPPLLVDGHPLALNAISTSKIVPGLPQLLPSTARGPPPQPPCRDYNEGNKGHGRSIKQCSYEVECPKSVLSTMASTSHDGIAKLQTGFIDRSAQTESNMISICTQTEIGDFDDQLLSSANNSDTNNLTPKERCKILQQINERLEMEKLTLMQIRLQVQLRIEEAEAELKHFNNTTNSDQKKMWGLKPTSL